MPCRRSACFGFSSGRYMLQANFTRPPLGFLLFWVVTIHRDVRGFTFLKNSLITWAAQAKYSFILKHEQCNVVYTWGGKKKRIGSKTKSPSCSNIKRRKSIFNPDRIKDSAFIARAINKSPGTVGHWVSLWALILAFIDFSCHLERSSCEKCTVLSGFLSDTFPYTTTCSVCKVLTFSSTPTLSYYTYNTNTISP